MKSDFTFADLLTLNKFITPTIITVVYWILMVVAILCGVAILATTNGLVGVLVIILAPLYVRLICEMIILWYRIHSVLCEIRDQRKQS